MHNVKVKITALAMLVSVLSLLTATHSVAEGNSTGSPILVELFTSEGCSSCPPADAWLKQIDNAQPTAGAQIIVLSEHVDYWDHDGWKDPHSSHALTERQNDYAHMLGLNTVYTPQIIVDGTNEIHLKDAAQTQLTFEKAAAAPEVPITISSVSPTPDGMIQAHVDIDGDTLKKKGDLFVAIALDHVESQVSHGENSGKLLEHVAVVDGLEKIATLKKGQKFNQDIHVKMKSGSGAANLRLVVFLQEPGPGRVLGAAVSKLKE